MRAWAQVGNCCICSIESSFADAGSAAQTAHEDDQKMSYISWRIDELRHTAAAATRSRRGVAVDLQENQQHGRIKEALAEGAAASRS